jgi:hypothetical protein
MRINWLGVIIAAILVVLLRHAWYAHFGGAEPVRIVGQVVDELRGDTTLALKELVNALVLCAALGWVIDASRAGSFGGGLGVGLAAGIGFAATSVSAGYIHGGPLKSFLIDAGYLVAAYAIAGILIGALAPKRSSRNKFQWGSEAAEH